MKVLYAAYRHNPWSREGEIGADYQFLHMLQEYGMECKVVGPFTQEPAWAEQVVRRIYKFIARKKYLKYDLSNSIRASNQVTKLAQTWYPDVIFSLYPAPIAFYHGKIPCIFRTDATFLGSYRQAPEFQKYGKLSLRGNIWLELRAMNKARQIITHSEWTQQSLLHDYHLGSHQIACFPNPAALLPEWIPQDLEIHSEKKLEDPLRLLFIGRDAYRKGLDIALETVNILNHSGLPVRLFVCGLRGQEHSAVTYFGNLRKANEVEREQFLKLLQSSHLLLHPARFDPSPRMVSEAAAFGTPTITNDVGGLATSVKHGISGLVLPRNSPPEAYVQAIRDLVSHSKRYYALCQSTRKRYERELNSEVASNHLAQILQEVAQKEL